MQARLIQVAAALVLATVGSAQAAPQKIEQLPRVVITGKSVQASQQIVQLPRVVIEGRSLASQPAVQLAAAKPARRI